MNEIEELKEKFKSIKKNGWIKSIRPGSTGIGFTFENLIGIKENKSESPDFKNIEIKTKRNYSNSYTTLFNATPEGPGEYEIKRLKENYGYVYRKNRKYRVINNSIYCNFLTKVGIKYYFKLNINRESKKIYLTIYDLNNKLIEECSYWSFELLKEKLYKKLSTLAFIEADSKIYNNAEYFKYYKLSIYKLKDFDSFINLIEEDIIRITFKIGVYLSGNKTGEIHDHGTGFDIKQCDLLKLYELYDVCI